MELSDSQKKTLLEVAKKSIENTVNKKGPPQFNISDPALNTECGAFVTIHKNGSLRGCIGHITGTLPLWQTVMRMAEEASSHDPRFPPVSTMELPDIDIEISVLSPFQKITDINNIEPGIHGIFLRSGYYQGLLLPQVATEYGWSRQEFIEHTCMKAGLGRNCYRNKDCEIFIFTAVVFSEKDIINS